MHDIGWQHQVQLEQGIQKNTIGFRKINQLQTNKLQLNYQDSFR
jgi:hypothetical protein